MSVVLRQPIIMNGNISQKVYEKITQENIRMRPRYYFKLVYSFWKILAAILLISAGLVMSFLFYEYKFEQNSDLLFWVFLVASLILVFLSSRAYRFSWLCCQLTDYKILSITLILAILLGLAMFNLNIGHTWYLQLKNQVFHQNLQ